MSRVLLLAATLEDARLSQKVADGPTEHETVVTPRSVDGVRGRTFTHWITTDGFGFLRFGVQEWMLQAVRPCFETTCAACVLAIDEWSER